MGDQASRGRVFHTEGEQADLFRLTPRAVLDDRTQVEPGKPEQFCVLLRGVGKSEKDHPAHSRLRNYCPKRSVRDPSIHAMTDTQQGSLSVALNATSPSTMNLVR